MAEKKKLTNREIIENIGINGGIPLIYEEEKIHKLMREDAGFRAEIEKYLTEIDTEAAISLGTSTELLALEIIGNIAVDEEEASIIRLEAAKAIVNYYLEFRKLMLDNDKILMTPKYNRNAT